MKILQASTLRPTTVSGQPMESLGMLKIKLKAGSKEIDDEIHPNHRIFIISCVPIFAT